MSNDEILFADEFPPKRQNIQSQKKWKILIVDDEQEIHAMTKLIIQEIVFEQMPIEMISAYSAEEAKEILRNERDIAIILLDVVMETEDAGLEVVKYLRQILKNNLVRIILRTGQPGQAPENEVIINYDINDYKEKTELTSQKLFTTIISALRSYHDLKTIERNQLGLAKIISASKDLFKAQSLSTFASGILMQLASLQDVDDGFLYSDIDSFAATYDSDKFHIIAGAGKFAKIIDQPVTALPKDILSILRQAIEEKRSIFHQHEYIGYFASKEGKQNVLYLAGLNNISDLDKELINVFASNISIAFENIYLNQKLHNTNDKMLKDKKNVISRLNEIIALRSQETQNHVIRVSKIACILGKELGMSAEQLEILEIASLMHDVGKIGIPEKILIKPGQLTTEEFEIIKTHSLLGENMLRSKDSPILQMASIISITHHEKWDGSGYPQGLAFNNIPLPGRIVALCDIFDALISKRSYKLAWTITKASQEIRRISGRFLDPKIVRIFQDNLHKIMEVVKEFPD